MADEKITEKLQSIDRVYIFKQYFESDSGLQFAKSQALSGTLQHSPLRSLCWRLFLEIIPAESDPSTWAAIITKQREYYEKLKKQYYVDPHEESELDLAINNPLSQVEDSPWQTYFVNKELQMEINQDIIRTYPEKEFFQEQSTRDMMLHILFTHAKNNPTLGYRQGMHELLAPILYLLHNERIPKDNLEDHVVFTSNSEEWIEHDAYTVFAKLMELTEPWFLRTSDSKKESDENTSPIVIKSKRIQNQLLKSVDPILQTYMTDLCIEPQLYILRWVRLLFGREFHLDDVLIIWDAIFAYGKQLILVDYICLAMLLYIRDQLLQMDFNGCLKRLFNYPPVEDVTIFIERAQRLLDPSMPKVKSAIRKQDPKYVEPEVAPIPTPERKRDVPPPNGDMVRAHMADRLERIIYILQQTVVKDVPLDRDTLSVTVAELKQIKDILSGALEDESVLPAL